jgi:hypothetical protein
MNLKKLNLGVQFEMETFQEKELDPNDPSLKAMQETARQLGIKLIHRRRMHHHEL